MKNSRLAYRLTHPTLLGVYRSKSRLNQTDSPNLFALLDVNSVAAVAVRPKPPAASRKINNQIRPREQIL